MGGFSVANFDFGKNIADDNTRRAQIASAEETARRGQDLSHQESTAALAERQEARKEANAINVAELDQRKAMSDDAAAVRREELAEGSRRFDESMNREDLKRSDYKEESSRANSWDDVLKKQELDERRQMFDERTAKLDSYFKLKQEEDEFRKNRDSAMESSFGNMAIISQLQNGLITPKQVDAFNSELLRDGFIEQGKEYNYIGSVDPTTNKPFEDGKLHFVRYSRDKSGAVALDKNTRRPLVEVDNPLNSEVRNAALSAYFGDAKEFLGNGSSAGLEIAKINADQKEKERDVKIVKGERDSAFREKKFQYDVSKDMSKEAKDFLSSLSDADKESFKQRYPTMAKSILGMNEDDGAGKEEKTKFKEGDEQDVNGVHMKLLPSKKNPGKLTWQRI